MARPRERWKIETTRNRVTGYIPNEDRPSSRPVLASMSELEGMREQEVAIFLAERYAKALALHQRREVPRNKSTFRGATLTYLEEKLWEGSTEPYSQSFNKFLEATGDFKLSDRSNVLNKQFIDMCRNQGLADSTIHKHQRHIQGAFIWLSKHQPEILPRNIEIEKVQVRFKKKQPHGEPTVWSKEEKTLYHAQIVSCGNVNHFRAYMLARYQIMRLSEFWSLPLERIDLDGGWIYIDNVQDFPHNGAYVKVKRKQARKIEIHPTAYDYMVKDLAARAPEEKWWLDNGKGKPAFLLRNSISCAFGKFRDAAGLSGDPLHCFRRSGITEMLDAEMMPVKVMALAGHHSMETTMGSYVNRNALEGSKTVAAII